MDSLIEEYGRACEELGRARLELEVAERGDTIDDNPLIVAARFNVESCEESVDVILHELNREADHLELMGGDF